MKIKSVNRRIDYVNNLELSVPHESIESLSATSLNFNEDGPDAKVVGGSTVSFVGGVPKLIMQDVLNSTLLAQLAANKAYDRETETKLWYYKYREVLENIGWVIQEFSFSNQSSSGVTVKLDKVALNILKAAMSGNELLVLKATLDALENADSGSKEVTLFDHNGSSGDGGNFQLSTASLDPNGNVQMSLGAFHFQASTSHTRFLFFSWDTQNINIYGGAQSVILNEQIYATVRAAINTKLGDKAQKYVADIDI